MAKPAIRHTHRMTVPARFLLATIVLMTAAGFFIRAAHRHHPMRCDEVATYIHFVMPHSSQALFNYTDTNNHLFHTILVLLSTQIRGSGPTAIRLPAFLAGVALIPAGGILAWLISGSALAGVLAAMLIATSSPLVEYSINARGYSLILLFGVLMGIAAVQIARQKRNIGNWALWTAAVVLGMWTIPIMLYPAATFSLILIVQTVLSKRENPDKKRMLIRWGWSVLISLCITGFLYLPLILQNGFHSLFVFPWVRPHSFSAVLGGIPETFFTVIHDWFRDTSWLYAALLVVGILCSAVMGFRRKDPFYWMPFMTLVVLMLFTLIQRVVLFARIWLFVLPLVLITASCGLASVPEWFSKKKHRWIAAVLVVFLTTAVSMDSARNILRRQYFISEDETTLVDAEAIARDIAPLCDGRTALVGVKYGSQYSLKYYQILYAPGRVVDYRNENVRRAYLAVGDKQDSAWVLAQNPGFKQHYGPLILWKAYPHSKVYLACRKKNESDL